MPEPIVTQEAPVIQETSPEVDLVTRVSQVKTETQAKEEIDGKFNINELDATIEKLPDPVLKEQVLGLKKSLLKGENQKYQEIANLRKQYETELAKQTSWTPERVQGLMQDQNFVKAAQSILNTPSQDNSMLTETERKTLDDNNRQIQSIMYQNQQLLRVQQDTQLKNKYANYEPNVVDKITEDLLQGRVQATREELWKVVDYDSAVKRAYELGKQDRQTQNQEKATGMTVTGGVNMGTPGIVERLKGETTQKFMTRAYQEHLKK
jgi:hypothetical protein